MENESKILHGGRDFICNSHSHYKGGGQLRMFVLAPSVVWQLGTQARVPRSANVAVNCYKICTESLYSNHQQSSGEAFAIIACIRQIGWAIILAAIRPLPACTGWLGCYIEAIILKIRHH